MVDKLLAADNLFGHALVPGKTYFARCKVYYGGVEGNTTLYEVGANFTVTVTQMLQQQVIDKMGLAAGETLAGKISETQKAIIDKVIEAKTAIESKVDLVKVDTGKILTDVPKQIEEKVANVLHSEILGMETTVRVNSPFTVRYRTFAGLKPTISVYDQQNMPVSVALTGAAIMQEQAGAEGRSVTLASSNAMFSVYAYDLKLTKPGDYTIICSEPVKGTMDAVQVSVIMTDLEDISGQVATVLGTTTSISELKNVAETLNSQFSVIESALGKINTDIVTKVKGAATSGADMESVYVQLLNVSKEIKTFAGNQNVSLDKLYEVTKEKKQDMKYLKNKTQELKAVMEINQKMIDNMANKPVTQTWFEYK